MPNKVIDITGQRYGRLTVLHLSETRYKKKVKWVCKCDCGSIKEIPSHHLRYGGTKSCGCSSHLYQVKTHHLSAHPIFGSWARMMARCYKPTDSKFPGYGGRGIQVCDRWHDVTTFIADNEAKHRPGLTIDRIDNDGHYTPDNCQWATPLTQGNNKRNNFNITFNGRTQTLSQWSRECGIDHYTIWRRLRHHGWSVERALTQPPRQCHK